MHSESFLYILPNFNQQVTYRVLFICCKLIQSSIKLAERTVKTDFKFRKDQSEQIENNR